MKKLFSRKLISSKYCILKISDNIWFYILENTYRGSCSDSTQKNYFIFTKYSGTSILNDRIVYVYSIPSLTASI